MRPAIRRRAAVRERAAPQPAGRTPCACRASPSGSAAPREAPGGTGPSARNGRTARHRRCDLHGALIVSAIGPDSISRAPSPAETRLYDRVCLGMNLELGAQIGFGLRDRFVQADRIGRRAFLLQTGPPWRRRPHPRGRRQRIDGRDERDREQFDRKSLRRRRAWPRNSGGLHAGPKPHSTLSRP